MADGGQRTMGNEEQSERTAANANMQVIDHEADSRPTALLAESSEFKARDSEDEPQLGKSQSRGPLVKLDDIEDFDEEEMRRIAKILKQ